MFFHHVTRPTTLCRFYRWLMALLPMLLLVTLAAPAVQAASLTVNSLADADNAGDGVCTLREAIIAANTNANYHECTGAGYSSETITFSLGGTITLGSSLPNITDAAGLTINGGDAVTISGNNAVRVFQVNSSAALALQNLIITNGNEGLLSGGLYNSGTTTIENSTFANNHGNFGGGISNANSGALTITNSTFTGNSAANSGAAISNSGVLTITNSAITVNNADSGGGGLVNFSGTLTVSNSTISGNTAGSTDGGALYLIDGTVTISSTTISGNTADGGGAIYNGDSTVTIHNSTISGNTAGSTFGGGLYNNGGAAAIGNSTISGNSADSGGGIFNGSSGTVTVANSTFSGNGAGTGGGIRNFSGTLVLTNTIVASSPFGGNCAGAITNGGHNLDSGVSCGWGSGSGSLSNSNPLLGPLAANGGPTLTFALSPGSPAIDAADNAACPAADQRGVTRPLDGDSNGSAVCDIGAYEFNPPVYLPLILRSS